MKDICCIGHITNDKIITPEETTFMPGGTSYYFSYALRSLPPRVSFGLVTKVAEEDMSVVEQLRADGVDVEAFPSRRTVFFENKYGKNTNVRTQRVLAKADPFRISDLSSVKARVYHLGTLLDDDFSSDVVAYLSNRGLISIDAQGFLRKVMNQGVYATDWPKKFDILCSTDIIKVNETEMRAITGSRDPHVAAKQLADWGVKEVLVTLGSYGSVIMAEGHCFDIPAYTPREIVDATGCGDTYTAGYLYCRSLGRGYEESGRYAAAMCTLKLQYSGPFRGTEEDVLAVMDTH